MQKGFSLGEMIIALVVMSVITSGILVTINSIRHVINRNVLYDQQLEWKNALYDIQDKYYVSLLGANNGAFTLNTATITLATNFDSAKTTCQTPIESMRLLLNDLGYDNSLLFDSWGGRWCLMLPAGTVARKFENYTANLKNLVVIGEGLKKGFQNTNITLTANACPKIEKDDTNFICQDGGKIVHDKIKSSIKKVDNIYDKLETYVKSRTENREDDISRNYFFVPMVSTEVSLGVTTTLYNPAPCRLSNRRISGRAAQTAALNHTDTFRTDITAFLDTTCAVEGKPITDDMLESLRGLIGVSAQDVVDGFGSTIYFDNGSQQVRHPFHDKLEMRTPPFNARIFTRLPAAVSGAENLIERYVGSY